MKTKPKTYQEMSPSASEACKSAMLEIVSFLGRYKKHFVLVGGLVPKILIDHGQPQGHMGTYDVDFAVNFTKISQDQYGFFRVLCGWSRQKLRCVILDGDEKLPKFTRTLWFINGACPPLVRSFG